MPHRSLMLYCRRRLMYSHLQTVSKTFTLLNLIEIVGIAVILLMAFVLQFVLQELPCPLCLLQRVGFLGVSISLLLNLRYGIRASHYSLALLFALLTGFVALRQVLLHIEPGTGTYGASILHYHLYTWSFIISLAVIIYSSIILGFDIEYKSYGVHPARWQKIVMQIIFIVVLLLLVCNVVATFYECGIVQCPDNPLHYKF